MNDNGSIIFNGSVHTYLGQPGVAAYAATKGGLVSMARSIAADPAPRKIRVNVVATGATKIPIWKSGARANATAEESAKVSDFFSSTVPLARGASRGQLQNLPTPFTVSRDRKQLLRQRCDVHGSSRAQIEIIARRKVAPAFEPKKLGWADGPSC